MKWLILLAVFVLALWHPVPARAASGITVTPATATLDLQSTDASKQLAITLHNSTGATADITLSAADFGALDTTGGLFFLGDSANKVWDPHRLANWISIAPAHVVLQPEASATVQVEIRNDASLAPGGHYAAVMGKISGRDSGNQLSINQVVSSLMFVSKEGGETRGLAVKKFDAAIGWLGGATSADMRLTNTGNTHVVPRGLVTLRWPFNQTLGRAVVNQTSTPLLPGISRSFDVSIKPSGLPLWPGLYMVQAQYRYDGSDQLHAVSKSVFYPGLVGIAAIALALFGALFLIIRRRRASKMRL